MLHPGIQSEEEKVRSRQQQALYRRLFMDIEREQVKENIRQRNHRLKMAAYVKLPNCSHVQNLSEQISLLVIGLYESVVGLMLCIRLKKQKEDERLLIESTLTQRTQSAWSALAEQSLSADDTQLELSCQAWRQAELRCQKQRETER